VPPISGLKADELKIKLFPGSSVGNPIDFLATGTAEQLGYIIDAVENDFAHIDGMVVIFGTPGLAPIFDVYELLDKKMQQCKKPIFPVLPSVMTAAAEIDSFLNKGRINFPDEVVLGNALSRVFHTSQPISSDWVRPTIDIAAIRKTIDNCSNGYIEPHLIQQLLDAAGIARAGEAVATTKQEAIDAAQKLGFPLVMKVIGPVHKSDVGGVKLNITSVEEVTSEFERMMRIEATTAILMQPMLKGLELFAGINKEGNFGHLLLCGMGGIFIEVLKDVSASLVPVSPTEATEMVNSLKSASMLRGVRGQKPVNITAFIDTIVRLSALIEAAPEIAEMDLNPLLGNETTVIAVDARVRINK